MARILIVEDETVVAADLQKRLDTMGYSSLFVPSGEEAIQKAESEPLDLVLMDIVLKGEINGIEAAAQIKAQCNIPVVFLTAYADEAKIEQAKVTEPFGYIVKPCEDRELHATIEMALYKHEMEKRVRESEQQLTTTLKCIGDAVITTDSRGVVTFMNFVAESLTGWSHQEAVGRPLDDVFIITNGKTGGEARNPAARVLKEGGVPGVETYTLIARDGKKTPIDESAAPIKDERGTTGAVVVFRDITERKRADEALQSEKDKLNALMDGLVRTEIGIDIVKSDYTILFQSQFLKERFGDVTGSLCYKSYRGLKTPCSVCPARRAVETGKPQSAEAPGMNGRTYEIISAPFPNPDGSVDKAVEVVMDITERKRAEIQLRDLFEASKLINSTMDIDKIFKFISDSYQELVGFDNFMIFLVSEDKTHLYPAYASDEIRGKVKNLVLKYGEGLVGHCVRTKETLLLKNAHTDPRALKIKGVTEPFTSQIVVPLIVEGGCVGAIHISKSAESAYDQDDVDALKPLSEVISSAVKNSRLYEEIKKSSLELEKRIEKRSGKIEILLNTRQKLQREGSWERGLIAITEAMCMLGFERCGVFLVNSMRKTLDYHFGKEVSLPRKGVSVPLSDSDYFGVKCVLEKKTILVRDCTAVKGKEIVPGAKSFVWVPIIVQNEAFAALAVDNIKSERTITEEDVKDLEILASMCAVFIDRTRILVEPAAEKMLKTELKYWLEPSEGYIVTEKKPEKSLEIFSDLVTHGIPGFVISRTFPEKLKKRYQLVRTPVLWFSRAERKDSISPDDLPKLIYLVGDFTMKSEESVILLDGLEYLLTQVNSETVLNFLQEVRDVVILNNSRLIIPLHKDALASGEFSILEKEFTVL